MSKLREKYEITWRGLPLWRSFKGRLFDRIKSNRGLSQHDMSNDDNIKKALDEAFLLGKKYGRMGMKIKYKL